MNARNVAGTSPSGRIMAAKLRIAIMTRDGPRILYFSIGGPSAKTPPSATAAPRAARTNENSRGAVPGPKEKPRCHGNPDHGQTSQHESRYDRVGHIECEAQHEQGDDRNGQSTKQIVRID